MKSWVNGMDSQPSELAYPPSFPTLYIAKYVLLPSVIIVMDCTKRRYYNCRSNDLFSQFANVHNPEWMFSLDNRWSCPMAANASWQHCYPQIAQHSIVTPSYDLSEHVELPPLSSPPRKENDTPSPFKFSLKTPTLPATRGIYKEFTLRDSIYQTDRSIP
jgi:hypothetical protein